MNISEVRRRFPQYDDLSDAQILATLHRKYYADMPLVEFERKMGIDPQSKLAEDTGILEAALIGAGKTFTDIGRGAQDLWYRAMGDDAARAELAARAARDEAAFAPLAQARPVATTIGEIAPYLAIPGAPAGAGLAARLGTEAAVGGGLGALEYDQNALEGAAYGAGGGALGALVGQGFRKLAGDVNARPAPSPEQVQMLAEAQRLGYKTTPAQRLGTGQLQKLEAGMSRYPLFSAAFDDVVEKNQGLANRIAREAIGESPEGMLTDNVLDRAHARIGKGYDDLAPKGFRLDLGADDDFLNSLVEIDAYYTRSPVREDRWPRFRDQFLEMAEEPISLREYHRFTSEIAKKARSVGRGENSDSLLEASLYAVREALDDALERSLGPETATRLSELRGQYRALKLIEKPGVIKNGNLKVLPLRNQLKREGRGRVRGDSELARVARVGEHFAPTVPTSGTAEAMAFQSMLDRPIMATAESMTGNLIGGAYMRGGGPLAAGMNIGQATAYGLSGGFRGYGSPAQLSRVTGLSSAPEQAPKPTAQARLGHLIPLDMIAPIRDEPWFATWLTSPVRPDRNSIRDHRMRLGKLTAKAKLTREQRAAVKRLQEHLSNFTE